MKNKNDGYTLHVLQWQWLQWDAQVANPDTNKKKETTTESVTVESNLENSLTQNNNEQNNQPSSESQTVASKESIGIKIEDNDSKADIADIYMDEVRYYAYKTQAT